MFCVQIEYVESLDFVRLPYWQNFNDKTASENSDARDLAAKYENRTTTHIDRILRVSELLHWHHWLSCVTLTENKN